MKRFIFATIAASATIFFAAGCQEKNEMAPTETSDRNVITASIPEAITRVSMNAPADGKGLALAWEAGDELTVIGVNSTEQFTIADGFTAHNAQFNGTAVDGDSFTVIYPGQTYKTLDEINAVSYLEQKQTGNGNTDHLFYHAMVETSDYTSLDFSKAKQNGVIKFLFQLPSEATVVESVTLSATDAIFYATNYLDGEKTNSLTLDLEDVDVSASEQMLTAYMMISWNDVTLPAASKLTITVNMPDSKFEQVLTVPETGLTILSGKVNTFGLNDKSWTEPLFFGGNGTEADPYQIKSYTHLDNVRKVINAETKTWFVMVDDIDMAGKNWTMYNGSTGNVYRYDFDGNDHTISNFSMTRSGASFFGALTGGAKVHDLKFEDVSLTGVEGGGNSVATVSYNINDGTIDNVDISTINITPLTNTGTGAIAAKLTQGIISNCDVTDLTITGTHQKIGGIVGTTEGSSVNKIEYCTVSSSTINGGWATGGIIGRHYSDEKLTISDCTVGDTQKPAVINSSSSSVGGILGEAYKAGTEISDCCVDATLQGTRMIGGIAGYLRNGTSIYDCKSIIAITCTAGTGDIYTGGIVGQIDADADIYRCSAQGNITASGAKIVGGIVGGIYGKIEDTSYSGANIYECAYLGGTLKANNRIGGIIGYVETACSIYDCYSTGDICATWSGGIVGWFKGTITGKTIQRCYSTASLKNDGRGVGGILGAFGSDNFNTRKTQNIGTVTKCIAWNNEILSDGNDNNECGFIIGGAGWYSTLSDCWRKPGMTINVTPEPTDQDNINSESPLTVSAYNGKTAGAEDTVSSIAQTKLGWSGDIWDFTTALPTLKNLPK